MNLSTQNVGRPTGNNAVIKYFKLPCYLQILLGLDSRFSLTDPEIWIKAYCLLTSAAVIIGSVLVFFDTDYFPLVLLRLTEYFIVSIVYLTVNNNRQTIKMYRTLAYIDSKLQISDKCNCAYLKLLFATPMVAISVQIVHLTVSVIWVPDIFSNIKIGVLLTVLVLGVEFAQSMYSVYFGIVWVRMKWLRESLQRKFDRKTFVILNKHVQASVFMHVKTYLQIYKSILNMSKVIERILSLPMLISLTCGFPHILMFIYNFLINLSNQVPTNYFFAIFAQSLQFILLPCLPGILAEVTSSEVDKIKLILFHRLMDIPDLEETERHNIEQFLEYVEARPYRCRIWRVLDVNVGLMIGLSNLCTTYLIVIIQFAHLY